MEVIQLRDLSYWLRKGCEYECNLRIRMYFIYKKYCFCVLTLKTKALGVHTTQHIRHTDRCVGP